METELNTSKNKRRWTDEEVEELRKLYPITPTSKLVAVFKRSYESIRKKGNQLRLKKLGAPPYRGHVVTQSIKMLSEFEKGWISALIDGEGSISLHISRRPQNRRYKRDFAIQPIIMITNNNLELLEQVENIIGGGIVRQKYKPNPKWKPTYHWHLTGIRRLLSLLKQVTPHLIVKRKQAELMLKYCSSRLEKLNGTFYAGYTQEEIEMAHQMGVLNCGKRHN